MKAGAQHLSAALAIGLTVVGCSESVEPDVFVTSDTRYATNAVFGEDADDSATVAQVGERTVTVGHVAAWLQLYPTLTVEQAVADLVDLNAVLATADDDDMQSTRTIANDARRLALAWRWTRGTLWDVDGLRESDPAEVELWTLSGERSAFFGAPELRTVSHVLAKVPTDATAAQRAEALRIAQAIGDQLAALDRRVGVHDFDRIVADWQDPLPEGIEFVIDRHLSFPRRYEGVARWGGPAEVVEPFAAASFNTPLGEMVGPIETQFGAHIIVVEDDVPAAWFEPGQREALAEVIPLARARAERFGEEIGRLGQAANVVNHPDNIGVLAMSPEERLQSEIMLRSSHIR